MRRLIPLMVILAGYAHAAKTLDIYFIDVEGGQSTLVVSPAGQTLLIDAGYARFGGRDALRIDAAAKAAHVKHIDYFLLTHHHEDHEGGVPNLMLRLPVSTFFDKGPTVEKPDRITAAYDATVAKAEHKIIQPGDKIPVKGLDVTVVVAAGKHIDRKGEPNPFCSGIVPKDGEEGENPQSAGVLIQFGKFRFSDLGDITWNKELALLCPENRVGKVDLAITTHHGTTESPAAIYAMSPRVIIMNNGPRKGGNPAAWKVLKASPGLEDMWQLHFAVAGGKDSNAPDTFIANVDEQCEGKYLKVSAEADGSFTVYNSRNKYTKTYSPK
ncbi:MAG: MBL fold metallo-hydrolase [Bryobacteraceae bacterium]|jgi:beta-lactamase superfamily II metal-dependent hydrolase